MDQDAAGHMIAAGDDNPAGINIPALVLTEDEAARMLRLSARTMQRLRLDGEGPRFVKLTGRRIGYAIGDLQAWIRARSVTSTSDATVRNGAGGGGQ